MAIGGTLETQIKTALINNTWFSGYLSLWTDAGSPPDSFSGQNLTDEVSEKTRPSITWEIWGNYLVNTVPITFGPFVASYLVRRLVVVDSPNPGAGGNIAFNTTAFSVTLEAGTTLTIPVRNVRLQLT